MYRLIIKTKEQMAELWQHGQCLKSYSVSTAANGVGCEVNSLCTPSGKMQVAEKIGAGATAGTIFRSRVQTSDIWTTENNIFSAEDLVLTRILWLEGTEDLNLNTRDRYIYLHGTNQEDKLGIPASHGCIRFSNKDICEVFNFLEVGSEVIVE